MATYTHNFDTPAYKGTATVHTGLFIGGKWVEPIEGGSVEVINPATGKVITSVSVGTKKDVDLAVEVAKQAYKTSWGHRAPGSERGKLLNKLADLLEANADEVAALEALDGGKVYGTAKSFDVGSAVATIRYYAGWADKVQGKTIETRDSKFAYTRHEPFGVVGQIIPWNFPLGMLSWKIAPALATGNVLILKPSELTPLTALKICDLVIEAGFPPGVVNIINGYGNTVGQAISEHPGIEKVAFTGSTLVGRKVLKAAADSNLKTVTLELGGKSPTVVFEDADLAKAIQWSAFGIFFNMGQVCSAGSRIFVQESVYDVFVEKFAAAAKDLATKTGDPFNLGTEHGPQISQVQFDRVMSYIEAGKNAGAKVVVGGERQGTEGFFIQPTVFVDTTPDMKIVQEEIFGPVVSIIKFKTEEEVIAKANDTIYGLASHVFTQNVGRAVRVAHALETGSVWVNSAQTIEHSVPFGGYKQSGSGRELGEYAIDTYTQVKGVHIQLE